MNNNTDQSIARETDKLGIAPINVDDTVLFLWNVFILSDATKVSFLSSACQTQKP